MSITVNTNIDSLFGQLNLSRNQSKLSGTLNRLSSGLRVNSAADDAAGYAIAKTMETSLSALKQGSRNANDGISIIQTAEGAMTQTLSLLQRMRELASQASSGTYGTSDLANINAEYTSLLSEVDRVSQTSKFNGISLLSGGSLSIQVGENNTSNDRLTITLVATSGTSLSINGSSVSSNTNARSALDTLSAAIDTVTTGLADLGAVNSNLEAAIQNNDSRYLNLQTAVSRIMDADFAEESSNLARLNILSQSNVAMLAQANAAPQVVLQLLRQ